MDNAPHTLSPLALPRPNPVVVFRTVSDGAVLLHMDREVYFGLNAVGSLVWQNLPPVCGDLDALCTRLRDSYPDVRPEVLRVDVAELLAQLLESELVLAAE